MEKIGFEVSLVLLKKSTNFHSYFIKSLIGTIKHHKISEFFDYYE